MGKLHDTELAELGLYRTSPGILGWFAELFTGPIILLLVGTFVWNFGIPQHAKFMIVATVAFCFLANFTFFLSIVLQSRIGRCDILYLRNYSKPSIVVHGLFRDVGTLQLLVRGILRPPYDIVSLFPPAANEDEKYQDTRKLRRRGLHHVFTFRTRDAGSWKAAVEHLMVKSLLIIVECYRIDGGFEWELHRIPVMVDANKVILVGDEDDRSHANKIKSLLAEGYRKKGASPEVHIPIIIHEKAQGRSNPPPFKERLMATVREHNPPYWDKLALERSPLLMIEIALKTLTLLFTLAWWGSVIIVLVLLITR